MAHQLYNTGGTTSSVGTQVKDFEFKKGAIIETLDINIFGQFGESVTLSKNTGKTIKKYVYYPLLDDRNINDQGIDASGVVIADGNLYGSSKDAGTIAGKLPFLTENGGEVNRVGYKRATIEGTIQKFGFADVYTQESLDFDSDDELEYHIITEQLRGARQVSEHYLQLSLLNSINNIRYGGTATSLGTLTGELASTKSELTYSMLLKLAMFHDDTHTPVDTKIYSGSTNTDTKTISAARFLLVPSEILPTLKKMKDFHNEKAFIEVKHYAMNATDRFGVNASGVIKGEVGAIDNWRIVVVPGMLYKAGVGENVTTNGGYRASAGKYNAYPLVVLGSESFAHINFDSAGGDKNKFTTINKKPGVETAQLGSDYYGEKGFHSIKWYQGILIMRPERLSITWVVAEL